MATELEKESYKVEIIEQIWTLIDNGSSYLQVLQDFTSDLVAGKINLKPEDWPDVVQQVTDRYCAKLLKDKEE